MRLIVIGVVLWCGVCMGQAHRAGATASGCSSASKSVAWMNEWVDDGKEFDSDKGMRRRVLAKDGQLDFQEDLPSDSGGQEFDQRNVFVAMNDLGDVEEPSESFGDHWNMTVRARQGAAEGPFRITLQRIRGTATVSGPEEVARSAYYVIHFRNEESAHAAYRYLRCKTR
jgi:hypothetical protein